MKKGLYFVLLFLYVIGVIGGIGYTIYYGVYHISLGIAVTGFLAFEKAKSYFDYLKS
jgi:hypothetical protein